MSARFSAKKQDILKKLSRPDEDYEDASPKGSVDEAIRDLIDLINDTAGFVTTSSCSGRIAVYLEGPPRTPVDGLNASDSSKAMVARAGGKGGGRWLFSSHEKLDIDHQQAEGEVFQRLGFQPNMDISYPQTAERCQCVHFKFEPMILHILTDSVKEAQVALNAALAAGFRESGISGILDSKGQLSNPMVAVRSSGLAMDSIIGFQAALDGIDRICAMVSESYLRTLVQVANERFKVNLHRVDRFRQAFMEQVGHHSLNVASVFEPADVRKERKRREGLIRQQALRGNSKMGGTTADRPSALEQSNGDHDPLDFDLLLAS